MSSLHPHAARKMRDVGAPSNAERVLKQPAVWVLTLTPQAFEYLASEVLPHFLKSESVTGYKASHARDLNSSFKFNSSGRRTPGVRRHSRP